MLLVLLLLCCGWTASSQVAAVDVGSDDANDQFVGSGSSGSSHAGGSGGSGSAHACRDCLWMLADPCSSEFNSIGCGTVTEGCPSGQEQRRQWYSTDGGFTWADRGLTCVGGQGAGSVDAGSQALQDVFARTVPPAHIQVQPEKGVLPQVPTIFSSGQPDDLEPSAHQVAGSRVVLRPRASWHWDFGDGAVLDTSVAASRYPDLRVSHVYRRSGRFTVRLTITWTASYTVDGQGPYGVDGVVTQGAAKSIQVGQGRAVLLPSG